MAAPFANSPFSCNETHDIHLTVDPQNLSYIKVVLFLKELRIQSRTLQHSFSFKFQPMAPSRRNQSDDVAVQRKVLGETVHGRARSVVQVLHRSQFHYPYCHGNHTHAYRTNVINESITYEMPV